MLTGRNAVPLNMVRANSLISEFSETEFGYAPESLRRRPRISQHIIDRLQQHERCLRFRSLRSLTMKQSGEREDLIKNPGRHHQLAVRRHLELEDLRSAHEFDLDAIE